MKKISTRFRRNGTPSPSRQNPASPPWRSSPVFPATALSALVLGFSSPAFAATFTWDGGGTDAKASTAGNWVGDTVPTPAGFDIVFSNTATSGTTVTWDNTQNFRSLLFDSAAPPVGWTINNSTGSPAQLQFVTVGIDSIRNDSTVLQTISAPVHVFFNGSKAFNANAGDLSLTTLAFRGDGMNANNTNTLILSGSKNGTVSGAISQTGTGTGGLAFTQTSLGLLSALTKTGTGTWTLSGVNTYNGATNIQAGTLTLSGNRTAAMGAVTVSGGGVGSTPTLNIQNGTFGTGQFVVGSGGSVSTVSHSAGTITSVGGSGLLMGSGGTASTANYNLSGGSFTVANIIMGVNEIAVGTGVNVFKQTGGNLTSTTLRVGRYDTPGSAGTDNTYEQSAGTATITNLGLGGNTGNASGTNPIAAKLTFTGGTFTNTNFASLSAGGANTSTITIGGTADVTLGAFPTVRGVGSTATINFDGGTLRPAAASSSYMGGLTNAFVTANGAKFDVATARDITVSQPLVNAVSQVGTLTKSGVGTLTLSGANTYTGLTTVSAGSLIVDGSLAGAVSVNAGTLGGSGSVAGLVTTSGVTSIISPGNSPGSLTLNGGLNAAAGATFTAEVGTSTDIIVMGAGVFTGSAAAGGLIWNFSDSGGLTAGNPYILATFGSSFGLNATDLVAGTLPAGFALDPAFGSSGFQINPNNLQVQFATVPEPSITAALLTGFCLLHNRRRRA